MTPRMLPGLLASLLAVCLVQLGPASRTLRAELMTTEQALEASAVESARARIRAFVAREDVREQLRALGVDPGEAALRIASLSDAEVAAIDGRLAELPAGGNGVAAVLLILAVVFIVLILFDYLGITDIFPWVQDSQSSRR